MHNHVREYRERDELTQVELGDKLKVSRQTLSSIEKGQYNPSLELALRIARQFNATVEEVFCLDDQACARATL